mgnify:CR=1 FL=1
MKSSTFRTDLLWALAALVLLALLPMLILLRRWRADHLSPG